MLIYITSTCGYLIDALKLNCSNLTINIPSPQICFIHSYPIFEYWQLQYSCWPNHLFLLSFPYRKCISNPSANLLTPPPKFHPKSALLLPLISYRSKPPSLLPLLPNWCPCLCLCPPILCSHHRSELWIHCGVYLRPCFPWVVPHQPMNITVDEIWSIPA